jgi:hypothetical protein
MLQYTQDATASLRSLRPLETMTGNILNDLMPATSSSGRGKTAGSIHQGQSSATSVAREQAQRLQAAPAGAAALGGAAQPADVEGGAGTGASAELPSPAAAAAATDQGITTAAAGSSSVTSTAAACGDKEDDKEVEQRSVQLRRCGELLQALGSRVWSLLPQRAACNNPACANLAGASEGLLVAGRGCVCGRCRVAR